DVTGAKQLERQMLLMERLTTAGRLAAGVAHELNNPLATIAGCAESLQGRLAEAGAARAGELDDFARYLRLIEEEAYRCKEITGSLLQFVRDPGSRRSSIDVNAVVMRTVELLSHQSRFADRRVVTELEPGLSPVAANEGQLQQVCLGLASNALEAMEGRGTLSIRSRVVRGEVEGVADAVAALERMRETAYDVGVLDMRMPQKEGIDVLRELAAFSEPPQVIVMAGFQEVSAAVEAMKLGAYDYLTKPTKFEEL